MPPPKLTKKTNKSLYQRGEQTVAESVLSTITESCNSISSTSSGQKRFSITTIVGALLLASVFLLNGDLPPGTFFASTMNTTSTSTTITTSSTFNHQTENDRNLDTSSNQQQQAVAVQPVGEQPAEAAAAAVAEEVPQTKQGDGGRCSNILADEAKDGCTMQPFTGPENMAEFCQSFREKGGVIIFLHNPKTGGSAVRKLLKEQAHVVYDTVNNNEQQLYNTDNNMPRIHYFETHNDLAYDHARDRITQHLTQGNMNHNIIIVENHVFPPVIPTLAPDIQTWRTMAQQHGIPMFVFTMYRDPLAWSISRFNYYQVHNNQVEPTEQNFVEKSGRWNGQCHYFLASQYGCAQRFEEQNRQALRVLFDQMDWISPTTTFADELVPLLAYLTKLQHRNLAVVQPDHFVLPPKVIYASDLSQSTLDMIQERTSLDQDIYNRVLKDYDFHRWREFLQEKQALTKCDWDYTTYLCRYPDGLLVKRGDLPDYLK